jgi:hypothetical protein
MLRITQQDLALSARCAAIFKIESATRITATVPSGGRKGLAMLTVTTASGEVSKTFLVK